MKNKITLALLASLIWGGGSWWWYTCKIKGFCMVGEVPSSQTQTLAQTTDNSLSSGGKDESKQTNQAGADNPSTDTSKATETTEHSTATLAQAEIAGETTSDIDKDSAASAEGYEDKADGDTPAPDTQTSEATVLASDTDSQDTPLTEADNTQEKTSSPIDDKQNTAENSTEESAAETEETVEAMDKTKAENDNPAADETVATDEAEDAESDNGNEPNESLPEQTNEEEDETPEVEVKPSPHDLNFDFLDGNKEFPLRAKIYFPANPSKAQLPASKADYFSQLIEKIEQNDKAKIILTGHTDDRGSDKTNKKVGLGRAQQIADILIAAGIPKARIETLSRGESQPIISNDTAEGRRLNRRVEMVVDL